jgi:hypothetical protein
MRYLQPACVDKRLYFVKCSINNILSDFLTSDTTFQIQHLKIKESFSGTSFAALEYTTRFHNVCVGLCSTVLGFSYHGSAEQQGKRVDAVYRQKGNLERRVT